VLAVDDEVDIIGGANELVWYDSELDFDCFFIADAEGTERCFPYHAVVVVVYSDANCTQAVNVSPGTGPCYEPPYSYAFADPDRNCAYVGFHLGAQLPLSTPLFYLADGVCQPQAAPLDGLIHELEPVPPETFVAMQRESQPRAPGLDAYVREGEDGSWQIIGYFDAERDAPCFDFPVPTTQSPRCYPKFTTSVGLFSDATCERRVSPVGIAACEVEPPTIVAFASTEMSACPRAFDVEVSEIGEIVQAVPYEKDDTDACVESPRPAAEFYVQGDAIDPATLPQLETIVVDTGEVRTLFSGFGGIPYVPLESQLDEFDSPCSPFQFPDGTLRCVPGDSPAVGPTSLLYEDAACTVATASWQVTAACAAEQPTPRVAVFIDIEENLECPTEIVVDGAVAVLGRSTATTFFIKDPTSGECEVVESSSPSSAAPRLLLGDALDASDFLEVRRVIRE
jgi:hypothetical protein